jgi:hypothetical protein
VAHRQTVDQVAPTIDKGTMGETHSRSPSLFGVEESMRVRRVALLVAAQEAPEVTAVFAQERTDVVFKMALKKRNKLRSRLENARRQRPADRARIL